ncbi:general substrate transporter [Syncephalastrum racemosum]|uniref:General substrate transporter n=1 Tax=Syncephalastrum racemosum TaxID=13706 RepID=A0A1X2HEW1_SYNRA|nr:general substrate transporter [Syncephalastrum racemosum]
MDRVNSETALLGNQVVPTTFVYLLVVSVCIGGFLFGYDTGVISGALLPLQTDFGLSTGQQEMVVGGTTLGAIFGGFFAGSPLVLVSSGVFILGSLVLAGAGSYRTLLAGRLVVGLGVGIASMIIPVYVSELAPKVIRGRLSTLNTLVVTFGQVVAYLVNIVFATTPHGWRHMFGLAAVPALCQLMVMPWMPESPRRMVVAGKFDEAHDTLRRIYGTSVTDEFIDQELEDIKHDIKQSETGSYRDLFHPPNIRPLLIACLLQAAQQLCGFNTAMYYAATIVHMAGFSGSSSTSIAIVVALTNMIFTAVAVTVIDRTGRRRMLISTVLVMVFGLIMLGAAFAALQGGFIPKQTTCAAYGNHCSRCVLDSECGWLTSQNTCGTLLGHENDIYQGPTGCPPAPHDRLYTSILITSLFVYVASYALGLGYAPWLMQSELFTLSLRGKANGISTAVNWTGNLIISSTFLSLSNALTTPITFWLYAAVSFIFWVLMVRMVPETANKSLEQIQSLFVQ